jgi:outer membrane lipoprotein LolB
VNARLVATGLLLLLLASGCATQQSRPLPQVAQVRASTAPSHWVLEGKIAVSDGRESGSGRLTWSQRGSDYAIVMRAPVSGQSWRLSGSVGYSQLEGVRPAPVIGDSAQQLLRRELGWELPVGEMADWIFAVGLVDRAITQRDAQGAPLKVRDAGWQLEYRDWQYVDGVSYPRRITARRGEHRVRLAIQRWRQDPVER